MPETANPGHTDPARSTETGTAPNATMPRVSIVIVSWNAIEIVRQCLPSVVETRYPNLEILFADNGSEDDTVEWVSEHFPSVTVIRHPENWAFCKGNNVAVARATGTYIVLLNNDVEVPADWLDPLVAAMEADREIGAVQPKMLDYYNRSVFEYAGAAGGFMDRNGYPFARGRVFFTVEQDEAQYDTSQDVFWATGAAIMTRKEVFDQLGGLDERLFMHMEEIDYCWRLNRMGLRVICQPLSRVYHMGGASLARGSRRKVFLNYRNNLLVLYKNLPPEEWRRILRARVLLDGFGIIRALVLLRPSESWAIISAFIAAHRMKTLFDNDRPGPSEEAILPPYRGNIIVDYFLRSRRRFADLPTKKFNNGSG